MKSDKRGLCGRCEEEYEPYMMLVPDNIVDLSGIIHMREKYGWFCPECLKEERPKSGIAILNNSKVGSVGDNK